MSASKIFKAALISTACVTALIGAAQARQFNIPGGDLEAALNAFSAQTGVQVLIAGEAVNGVRSKGVAGDFSADAALSQLLSGTGFSARKTSSGAVGIVRERSSSAAITPIELAQAAPSRGAVETVTVTSSKLGGADVQSIPIAITALSQEQLTATQTAGGPDLVKQVPNLTFTKTNFSGYSIQIRGIGTQAISVTTDPAVAVAFNDMPFLRNHFFEQEFFDVGQVQVVRGPQGTLYGRNATAGVVNISSAKPSDQFEAMASGEIGNYKQRRFEAMLNLPIVDDRFAIRLAGEWTKREGYSFNAITNERIDGRDLWSGRATIGWKPTQNLQTYLVWEHFQENDDRIRSSKQLCKTDIPPDTINGVTVPMEGYDVGGAGGGIFALGKDYLSQGCVPTSMYSPDAFQVPYGFSLPYVVAGGYARILKQSDVFGVPPQNPYASTVQSPNLRIIDSTIDPVYKTNNDILQFNVDYTITPELTFYSQTGFNHDFMWATQDFNRFNTSSGVFNPDDPRVSPEGFFCDPQLGCADRLVAQDLVTEHSWQLNQEFRLASNFQSPFNFSVGANYMHYETAENYYVFANTLTAYLGGGGPTADAAANFNQNYCLRGQQSHGYQNPNPDKGATVVASCGYVDNHSIYELDNKGHNYFLSQNPYVLNSYAAFGEAYYNVTPEVKLIGGARFTRDEKHFTLIPSMLILRGYGYIPSGTVDQDWGEWTGRAAVNWTPKLDFTDQTMAYASYARGYKAGGANPPGALLATYDTSVTFGTPVHPLAFDPEFVNAFEVGTKNTLLDGALTLNGNLFYYDYKGYQISEIVDRTAINLNFDAKVKGAELEATWEPVPGLRFNFGGGWEHTELAEGSKAVDLMDRADLAHHPDWIVVKPFVSQSSNCIFPRYVVSAVIEQAYTASAGEGSAQSSICGVAYQLGQDPIAYFTTVSSGYTVPAGYPGFDPASAPNNGEGFDKDLSGNELPNAPPFTVSMGAQYSIPLTPDWAGTLRGDFYWQDNSWARVFNDNPYDRIHGYTNLNLTLILTSQNGWQVMLYDKNVFNTTAVTGTFLNSDDSGLTTNVFLTDPKLIGVRVTKNW